MLSSVSVKKSLALLFKQMGLITKIFEQIFESQEQTIK